MENFLPARENRQIGARLRLANLAYQDYKKAYRRWHSAYKGGRLCKYDLACKRDLAARKAGKAYHEVHRMLNLVWWQWIFGE